MKESKPILKDLTDELYYKMKTADQHRLAWYTISYTYKLSEDIIREFQDKLSWSNISLCQNLSENFIREFKDYVYWDAISVYQKLSFEFVVEFIDKINIDTLKQNKNLNFTDKQWATIETLSQMYKS